MFFSYSNSHFLFVHHPACILERPAEIILPLSLVLPPLDVLSRVPEAGKRPGFADSKNIFIVSPFWKDVFQTNGNFLTVFQLPSFTLDTCF